MKVETGVFAGLTVFFAVVGTLYGMWGDWYEPVGFIALYLAGGLSALIGFYMFWTGRKLEPRPEDDPDGEIAQAEGDYGFFSPHSWWPLALGASSAVIFAGLAVGWWLVILGIPFAVLATIGWTFEYFRGDHAL
ncbi:MAG TPA: cytochrome c oxidase subunit 4 [Segeticoccus sp.]|uniref:cytochrome c oxidase subunit 4 n=1 Tax=Segeticoccus sp. TaxID=2706531 RepID=UPI002D7FABD4|nr:cytochrome c oxidase subunit 4 [Segeticoccus sp.]HET8600325.1 cytochrome c oxidase subunit 4 [Segeticoccus sp.]